MQWLFGALLRISVGTRLCSSRMAFILRIVSKSLGEWSTSGQKQNNINNNSSSCNNNNRNNKNSNSNNNTIFCFPYLINFAEQIQNESIMLIVLVNHSIVCSIGSSGDRKHGSADHWRRSFSSSKFHWSYTGSYTSFLCSYHRHRLGGQPGHVPPIIEKRLCFHQFLSPFALPEYFGCPPVFLTSLR